MTDGVTDPHHFDRNVVRLKSNHTRDGVEKKKSRPDGHREEKKENDNNEQNS